MHNDVVRKVAEITTKLKQHGFNTNTKEGNPSGVTGAGEPTHALVHIGVLNGKSKVAQLDFFVALPSLMDTTHIGFGNYGRDARSKDRIEFYAVQGRKTSKKSIMISYDGPADLDELIGFLTGRSKSAAQVGTDVARIYAISPEMLYKLIQEGEWLRYAEQVWGNPEIRFRQPMRMNISKMESLIVQHGGAVFNTGGDGIWDVEVEGSVSERGYEEPYGEAQPDVLISKVAGEGMNYRSGDDSELRRKVIRMAYEKEEMREHLLPLLSPKKVTANVLDETEKTVFDEVYAYASQMIASKNMILERAVDKAIQLFMQENAREIQNTIRKIRPLVMQELYADESERSIREEMKRR